jgi:hypothetical protein
MQPFSQMNTEAMRPSTLPSRPSSPQSQNQVDVYFFFSAWLCSFRTFLTIFCSSMRKARTMRSRTQLPHLEPPYARCTVFLGLEIWAYSRGRRAGIWNRRSCQQAVFLDKRCRASSCGRRPSRERFALPELAKTGSQILSSCQYTQGRRGLSIVHVSQSHIFLQLVQKSRRHLHQGA